MMNYNAPIQSPGRPVSSVVYKQQVRRQQVKDLLVGAAVWKAFGKLLLITLPILFAINLCLSLYQGEIESNIAAVEDVRFELMNTHIALRAEKARLMSPEYIQNTAGEKLALHVPRKGQVKHF